MMADFLQNVWETVWQMSLTGGFVCLAVCVLRFMMKKAPKSYAYALWAVVFLRLVCPVGLSGNYSIIPRWDMLGQNMQYWVQEQINQSTDTSHGKLDDKLPDDLELQDPVVQAPIVNEPVVRPGYSQSQGQPSGQEPGHMPQSGSQSGTGENGAGQNRPTVPGVTQNSTQQNGATQLGGQGTGQVTGQLSGAIAEGEHAAQDPPDPSRQEPDSKQNVSVAAMLWMAGILVIAMTQWGRTRRWKNALGIAATCQGGVHEISNLETPFVMGFFHPQIYLPVGLDPDQKRYVLLHEETHIRRRDYLVKGIAFGVTCIHWFNPLAWLAYYLMCMDMEMSCDEMVLTKMEGGRKAYAQALLSFAEQSAGRGLAFGEPYAKKRIRNVLQYRRLNFEWSVILTIVCLLVSGCLMTDPQQTERPESGKEGEIIIVDRETQEETRPGQENDTDEPETQKPTEGPNQDKTDKEDNNTDETDGELPVLAQALLDRLNQYPQADQDTLDRYTQLLMDPYRNPFIVQNYREWTEENMSQMAGTLAQLLSSEEDISDEEVQKLKAMGMEIDTDLVCVSTEDILRAWLIGTGTKFSENRLTEVLKGWYYLEETDRWYSQAGGVEYLDVTCVNVYPYSDRWTLVIYQNKQENIWGEALLRNDEDGGYIFTSNALHSTEGYEELYAPDGFYATAVKCMEAKRDSWLGGILAAEKSLWFADYNGETLQILDGEYSQNAQWADGEDFYWYESPMYCDDIVYYRPSGEETVDEIAATMMEAIVDRMTEPSDVRPFTITKYRIVEKEITSTELALRDLWDDYHWRSLQGISDTGDWKEFLKEAVTYDGRAPIGEDMWYFIPHGYAAFDGPGLLGMTMEDEISFWPEGVKDGMIPFQAQGGNVVFLFILIKDGDVYRLQRGQGMIQSLERMQKEAAEQEAYLARLETYEKSFQVGSKEPQITDKAVSWYADLNDDGQDEQLVFDWGYMDPGSFAIFAVLSADGEVLYVEEPASAHAGWTSYYVCHRNGRDYLLRYMPSVSTGVGEYSYTLFEWNEDDKRLSMDQKNKLSVVDQKSVSFHMDSGEYFAQVYPDWQMDVPAMVDFALRLNQYIEKGYLLFSTDQDWLGEEIQNSETGMFVLGSQNKPYRQYENYTIFSGWGRPSNELPDRYSLEGMLRNWCRNRKVPYIDPDAELRQLLDYIDSYQVGSTQPQITANSVVWEADLTHDGLPEKVIFDWSEFDGSGEGMFAVLDDQGKVLYSDEVASSHSWWRTYYLCQWEGKEYIFRYDPYFMQYEGTYSYELFYLTAEGEKVMEDEGAVAFSDAVLPCAANQNGTRVMDIPAMVEFAETVNDYVASSFLVVSSDVYWVRDELYSTGKDYVIGSPQEPYQRQETYWLFDNATETLELDLSGITDVAEKIKAWCEAAKIPYVE